jgi:hypothetical protein
MSLPFPISPRCAAYLAFQDLRELDRHPQVRKETAMIKDSLKEELWSLFA